MHFTVEAQKIAARYLSEGGIAIDATCGNGFDTLFLAEQVGSTGIVYSVDLQSKAIETASRRLSAAGTLSRCRLVAVSHSELRTIIEPSHAGLVSVVMFNLGYLPFGDKSMVTKPESTLAALDQAIELVRSGGLISVLAYPGHAGGSEESQCVAEWVQQHDQALSVERFQDNCNCRSPILWVLTVG